MSATTEVGLFVLGTPQETERVWRDLESEVVAYMSEKHPKACSYQPAGKAMAYVMGLVIALRHYEFPPVCIQTGVKKAHPSFTQDMIQECIYEFGGIKSDDISIEDVFRWFRRYLLSTKTLLRRIR